MNRQFDVVHDDADIIVVDKAPGVLTVPTPRRERNTLVNLVSRHVRRELVVVHRLDRDTSGLVVFAKSERAARSLMERWRADHERVYAAIVHGVVAADDGVIESRLITDARTLDRRSLPRRRAAEAAPAGRGELAITRYRVVERMRTAQATLVDVELETGRRNQIRVHMRELGHPLLGDDRYARDVAPNALWQRASEGRLALHARLLALVHPRTGERLRLESPLPTSFVRFIEAARRLD